MKKTVYIIICSIAIIGLPGFTQEISIKTNLLYDATTTINLGAEIGVAPKWTIDFSGNYNPWTFADNKKMKLWLVQPEARWWTCERFLGHFIGFHLLGGQYNVGGMLPWGFKNGKMMGFISNENILKHRYQGWAVGTGVSYGYQWVLSNRWSIEATIGIGYAYLKYDKYKCRECGESLKDGHRNYFGPTKAGISLIYVIK